MENLEINKTVFRSKLLKLGTKKNKDGLSLPTQVEVVPNETQNIGESTIIEQVNQMITDGITLGGSDIHIEGCEKDSCIRFRIDGVLREYKRFDKSLHETMITRLKVMSGMNIAEKRLPQDGRFDINTSEGKIDIRVACICTTYGEKMVLRILNAQQEKFLNVGALGMSSIHETNFKNLLKNPMGIILVTGPTGSGKSTTLYAAINEKNNKATNIMTLEDPIEKRIEDINQIQINTKIDLTFAKGLRAILRQDPDIIMLGEIRDVETANISVRAAITGHLVLSTLHTNDAATAIVRLIDMGIEPYLISSALIGVVAQRLVRCICKECKEEYESTKEEMEILAVNQSVRLNRGVGCEACNFTGYKGRCGVYEVLPIKKELRALIKDKVQLHEIHHYMVEQKIPFLQEHLREHTLNGVTTTEEYLRVMYRMD